MVARRWFSFPPWAVEVLRAVVCRRKCFRVFFFLECSECNLTWTSTVFCAVPERHWRSSLWWLVISTFWLYGVWVCLVRAEHGYNSWRRENCWYNLQVHATCQASLACIGFSIFQNFLAEIQLSLLEISLLCVALYWMDCKWLLSLFRQRVHCLEVFTCIQLTMEYGQHVEAQFWLHTVVVLCTRHEKCIHILMMSGFGLFYEVHSPLVSFWFTV